MSLLKFAKSLLPNSIRERHRHNVQQRAASQTRDAKPSAQETRVHEQQLVSRIAALKGRYCGQRCFIMGNGPSLNEMDLDLFAGENMWCTNRAYLLFDRINWRPTFYTGVDRRVIPDVANELNELPNSLPDTTFFWPLFFHQSGDLQDHQSVIWFREQTVDETLLQTHVFSEDCHDYVVHPRTVTITAIQLASYLGFNPIYLIGCDTNYTVPKDTTIEEEGDAHKLTSTADNDPNHFDPSYFGAGKKWHAPHPERMIEHYLAIQKHCEPKGIEIINATVGGMLEVFPRADYRQVLGE